MSYTEIVGATNFKRKKYKSSAETSGTFVITLSNEDKIKLVDGDEFSASVELNDPELINAIVQKSDIKGWQVAFEVASGTTILIGRIIGVAYKDGEDNDQCLINCVLSNSAYLTIDIKQNKETKAFTTTLASAGKLGSNIIANPSESATQELEKLQVGGVVYSIPKGAKVISKFYPNSLSEDAPQQINLTNEEKALMLGEDDVYIVLKATAGAPTSFLASVLRRDKYTNNSSLAGAYILFTSVREYSESTKNYTGLSFKVNPTQNYGTLYLEVIEDVKANPTLAGTENNLTGLQVGDTKYAVSSGVQFLAPAFDQSITYNYGDLCVYQNVLYACKAGSSSGAWDNTKWETTTISESVLGLLNVGI